MTKLGMKRTTPQLPLKRRTPLRASKGLNRMSNKAKEELKTWLGIKAGRIQKLQDKFDYIPCEYCFGTIYNLGAGSSFSAEAHHNDGNRRHNIPSNCRIVHRYCNQLIEDKNIKDMPSLL